MIKPLSDEDLEAIRRRHEWTTSSASNGIVESIERPHADRGALLAEVDRLRAEIARLTKPEGKLLSLPVDGDCDGADR